MQEVALKKLSLDMFFLAEIRMFYCLIFMYFGTRGQILESMLRCSFSVLGVRINGFFVAVAAF